MKGVYQLGIWGTGLYDNDCTADVKDALEDLLLNNAPPQTAAAKIREIFQPIFTDPDDGPLVELALQEQLFHMGAIKESDRKKMIAYLQSGADLSRWMLENPEAVTERQNEIVRLELLFSSPLPRRMSKSKNGVASIFNWCVGQVFALPITKSQEYIGEYILLYVCGEGKKNGRYRVPKVRIKLTKDGTLPKNVKEFNNLEYVQLSCTAMENRMGPFSRFEDIPKEFQQEYCPNKWGTLPEYTITIHEYSDIHPPQTMIYLGCWQDIESPQYDYIKYPFPFGVAWDYLEEFVLKRYNLYNLGRPEI